MNDAPHILLVDDDQTLLQALPHMVALRIHGVQIDTSDTAQRALEQLQMHDYDVIVSDFAMPGMNGLQLLTKVQEMRPEIPTLLITAHVEQTLITEALRGGAYDFIQKPIDRVYFVAALHRAIQTRQLRRQVAEQQRLLALRAQELESIVEQQHRELLVTNEALEELVRDVLDTSLVETNRFVLHRRPCDLVELCRRVLDAYNAGTGQEISFECTESRIAAEVDWDRISQVLIHLLSHARRALQRDVAVAVTLRRERAEAMITVIDEGSEAIGDMLPHVFERFSQLPDGEPQSNSLPRFGLGLYLSKTIVERHGGRMTVERDQEGRGRIFSVTIPLLTTALGDQEDVSVSDEREPSLFQPPQWLVS